MRTSKYLGFLVVALGALIVVCAAVLPISASATADGSPGFTLRGNACGPAAYAAFHRSASPCRQTARRRLLGYTTAGLVAAAVGLVMFANGDTRGSRVAAPPRRRAGHTSA